MSSMPLWVYYWIHQSGEKVPAAVDWKAPEIKKREDWNLRTRAAFLKPTVNRLESVKTIMQLKDL